MGSAPIVDTNTRVGVTGGPLKPAFGLSGAIFTCSRTSASEAWPSRGAELSRATQAVLNRIVDKYRVGGQGRDQTEVSKSGQQSEV